MSTVPAERTKRRILIQKVEELPTLPVTLTKIIKVAENPNAGASDLAQVISQDQSIASTILRLVNSAFYGHFRSISSISHAIVILGFQTVKSMALGASIFRTPPLSSKPVFDRNSFWVHSISVAAFVKKLAASLKLSRQIDLETVFVSGLLHDLGKVVFDNYFNEDYREVVKITRKDQKWIRTAEDEVMGMNHTVAGQLLARKWQFPALVIEAIEFHHDLGKAGKNGGIIAPLVHTADYCCNLMRIGSGGNVKDPELDGRVMKLLGLSDKALADISTEIENERGMIEALGIE